MGAAVPSSLCRRWQLCPCLHRPSHRPSHNAAPRYDSRAVPRTFALGRHGMGEAGYTRYDALLKPRVSFHFPTRARALPRRERESRRGGRTLSLCVFVSVSVCVCVYECVCVAKDFSEMPKKNISGGGGAAKAAGGRRRRAQRSRRPWGPPPGCR